MCLPGRCIATRATRTKESIALLLLRLFASAGMCLQSRCLEMNYSCSQASYHIMFMDIWIEKDELETGFFVRKGVTLAVQRIEFVSDRVSY
jgi:hypothetical protein